MWIVLLASIKWLRKRIVRKYEYLIVYKGSKGNKLTNGMLVITSNGKINDLRHLKAIQENIKKEEDLEKVIITNYKVLKKVWRVKNDL